MDCDDLTSPVLLLPCLRIWGLVQHKLLHVLGVLDVLLLRNRALPLASSLLLGFDIESC